MSQKDNSLREGVLEPSLAERRHLTVLFCDLVGSTQAAASLDPEDYYEVLRLYQAQVKEAVHIYSGTIAQFLGDGILAYFGYPQASEDDAERAVLAGLDIISRLKRIKHPKFQCQARAGIATGLVIVGDTNQIPAKGELLAIGETPNLASRLQTIASPNTVMIAETTRRLVGGLFDCAPAISLEIKGFSSPINAYEVLGLSYIDSRFEALRTETTPFIGRADDISLILRKWEHTQAGEGRVILLQGEAGIGKSRLLDQLYKEIADIPYFRMRFYCSPLHTRTALFPLLTQVRKLADLKDDDTDAAKLSKLNLFFSAAFGSECNVDSVADLLGLPATQPLEANQSNPHRKDEAFKLFFDYPIALSRQQPVLVVLEDAHWIDPTSLELLDRLVSAAADYRILVIVTARLDFQPIWTTHPSVTVLSLSRFGWRDATAMITHLAGGAPLPQEINEHILDRSDGIPLFVEELTRTLLDNYIRDDNANYSIEALPQIDLPHSLHDSLTARLDKIGPVKSVAQIGAVIGREFSHSLLQSVTAMPAAELEDALGKLISSGIVYRRGVVPDAVYIYKHALIQDAAYTTLLKSRRQQLHATIARTLIESFPALAANQPEVIAHHLTCAEDFNAAIPYWLAAGKAQIKASGDLEAVEHLKRGIGLLEKLDDAGEQRRLELELRSALIGPLVAVKGPFSGEVAECCARGFALSTAAGSPMAFPFLYGEFTSTISTGRIREAVSVARRFISLSGKTNYVSGVVVGHRLLGLALLALGEFKEARAALEYALSNYVAERDDMVTFLYGQNTKVNTQTVLSLVLYCMGEEEAAKNMGFECLEAAEKLKHPHSTAISIAYFGCWVLYLSGDIDEMERQANRLIAISTEFKLGLYVPIGQFFSGLALHEKGHHEAGHQRMEHAIAALKGAGFKLAQPSWLCLFATAKYETGHVDEARQLLEQAKTMMAETEEFWFSPCILSLEAELAANSGQAHMEQARLLLDAGIKTAQEFGSPILEDRCRAASARIFTKEAASVTA